MSSYELWVAILRKGDIFHRVFNIAQVGGNFDKEFILKSILKFQFRFAVVSWILYIYIHTIQYADSCLGIHLHTYLRVVIFFTVFEADDERSAVMSFLLKKQLKDAHRNLYLEWFCNSKMCNGSWENFNWEFSYFLESCRVIYRVLKNSQFGNWKLITSLCWVSSKCWR